MKNAQIGIIFIGFLSLGGCAEKQTRLWVEPPLGTSRFESRPVKYSLENKITGTHESIEVPVHTEIRAVLVDSGVAGETGPELNGSNLKRSNSATLADQALKTGKLPSPKSDQKEGPVLSYLEETQKIDRMYREGHYKDALNRMTPLVLEYPEQSKLWIMQGTLWTKVGNKKLALESYKKALELSPERADLEKKVAKLESEIE